MAKMLLSAEGIKVRFGSRKILDIDRLELYDGDRIGLVGENGAGKTTLLDVLSGARSPDGGTVRRLAPVAVIRQDARTGPDRASAEYRRRFRAPEAGVNLSGGEETRRRIAAALSKGARVLLADEPTSDLDEAGVRLLTDALKGFDGALVLVSHDRALLDGVARVIGELEDGTLTLYPGNYSAWQAERARRRAFERSEYDRYRAEQARLRKSAQRMAERASQVHLPDRMGVSEARLHRRAVSASQGSLHQARKALESRLEKLPEARRPREDPEIRMEIAAGGITSRVAAEARGLTLRAGEKILLRDADFCVPTFSRTALLGPNGCGKTTLIRALLAGDGVAVRPGVRIGALDQGTRALKDSKSALENAMRPRCSPERGAHGAALLGIRGDAAQKTEASLSGGSASRWRGRLMASDSNFLGWTSPPTPGHLSLEALGDVLAGYGGTLLFVSHDSRIVEQVASGCVFEGGRLVAFEGTMAEWRAAWPPAARPTDDPQMRMRSWRAAFKARKGDAGGTEPRYDEIARQLRTFRSPEIPRWQKRPVISAGRLSIMKTMRL